jgi:NitT/TauT family transport system substrate-binding protein
MTIATGVDPAFAHFYIAKEAGIFERNGLDVTVNTGASGSAMIPFLVGNQVNAVFGAEQGGVSSHIVDPNVVCVAEGTALLRWMGVVARGVEALDGLKGKKIGLARGTASETLWLSILAAQRMDAADYTIVYVDAPEMIAALERGNIDAYVVWEPWMTRGLRAIPNTKVLITNEHIQIIRNLIYMNKGWAQANEAAAKGFLRSMIQAAEFIAKDATESARLIARFLRQDRVLVAELMTKLDYRLNLSSDTVGNVQLAINQLRGMGRLGKEVTPAEVIWPDLLRGVDAARVTL